MLYFPSSCRLYPQHSRLHTNVRCEHKESIYPFIPWLLFTKYNFCFRKAKNCAVLPFHSLHPSILIPCLCYCFPVFFGGVVEPFLILGLEYSSAMKDRNETKTILQNAKRNDNILLFYFSFCCLILATLRETLLTIFPSSSSSIHSPTYHTLLLPKFVVCCIFHIRMKQQGWQTQPNHSKTPTVSLL